ncbi:MAG: U32 family peptidase [Candidatus Izemoplasmatales bacterium]|jgi:putative protease|nr:U32 family peptidase [Candidatus Izemoplasmatales bacterium]MDD5601502.1 U32 family peptidase [Candidatus Izemoplasmatales bacterium]
MKPELLAPAGDLDKVRLAYHYGADSVYIGGKTLSLRARASQFDLKLIQEATQVAHEKNKKLYVTVNVVPHDEDLELLDEYLSALGKIGVDALICSDPYVIDQALKLTAVPIHLSTQFSPTNSALIDFWLQRGVQRVVLARELTLAEMRLIRQHTKMECEVFIHGGMCVSYSGRCTLSNRMTGRDANRGGCAHSCRWKYRLIRSDDTPPEDFWMASKDLETIRFIPDLVDLGIASFKIEGRMKSHMYIAAIVKAYRALIDDLFTHSLRPFSVYEAIIQKAENRHRFSGFVEGNPDDSGQIFTDKKDLPIQNFVGIVRDTIPEKHQAWVETRNAFSPGDDYEVFSPSNEQQSLRIIDMTSEDGTKLSLSNHPLEKVLIQSDILLSPYDIIRKVVK